MGISFSIIGHNELSHLKELLPSLSWANEIIYVDCDSADDSAQYAKSCGAKVFSRPNLSNLNENKSFGINQASENWVFYLDPDERISNALRQEIQGLLEQAPVENAYLLKRRNYFFGSWLKRGSQYPDFQLRLFKKGSAKFENEHVHEKLQVSGEIGHLSQDLLHHPYLNISQFIKKMDFYTSFNAKFLFDQGLRPSFTNHLLYLTIKPSLRFFRRYFLKLGLMDQIPGLFARSPILKSGSSLARTH